MKRNFFSRITHELRSPVTIVDGLLSILFKQLSGSALNASTNTVVTAKNNIDRLTRLIDDLLTATKLEAKREELEPTIVDIRACGIDVYNMYAAMAREKGIALKVEAPPKGVLVWADREKILHILINLLSNALKYTERGEVKLVIQESGHDVRVSVSDTGRGIPREDRPFVFNKFFRSKETKSIRGTGLGLFIVKSFVDMHRGKIWLEENPGGGSIFRLALPKGGKTSLSSPPVR